MTDSLAAHPADATRRRRWTALIFISIAQLMVIFDASIMNIALPQAQLDLAFSDADRQWVITAYSLAFGALLLLGGRLSDQWGAGVRLSLGSLVSASLPFSGVPPSISKCSWLPVSCRVCSPPSSPRLPCPSCQ